MRRARHSFTRRWPALALAGALFLLPTGAHAADEANLAEAKSLFNEGTRLFKSGDYEHARVKYMAAHALVKSDDILWNLAVAEAKSGHAVDAVNHFREYEREPKARAGDVKEAEGKWLPELGPQVGQLAIDGAAGTGVKVDGGDGAGVLPLGAPYAVAPGRHHVEGRQGADLVTRDIDVAGGQTVAVHLVPQAVVVAPVAVATEPAAVPPSPAPEPEPVEHPGLTTGRKVAIGLGVAAVAVAGAGIVFGVVAKSKDSDAQSDRSGKPLSYCNPSTGSFCTSLHNDSSAARSDATVANVLYVGGGVVAAAAIVTWLVSAPREERGGLRIDPAVGPGFAGLRMGGSF